ncbi:hypothetical protein PG994_004850 [Apiospora phragmitis]|uniref:Uncharacterized protein n=1 Tax=Apiospora phragmitis TaxID=2905665 RepID=A0ABR1VRR0_9PEZI
MKRLIDPPFPSPYPAVLFSRSSALLRACYSTEHHYTGNTGEHHSHQDAVPKCRSFAAEVGDKLGSKPKQEQWQPNNPQQWESSSKDATGQKGKKWNPDATSVCV